MGLLLHKGKGYTGGASKLRNLLDVLISNPSNGEILAYNNEEWENSDILQNEEVIEGKNLFEVEHDVYTFTTGYLTYTVNKNNEGQVTSVVLNTSQAMASTTVVRLSYHWTKVTDYIGKTLYISGCTGGGDSTYRFYINMRDSAGTLLSNVSSTDGEASIVVPANTAYAELGILVFQGQSLSNVTIYPMVSLYSGILFEPYHDPIKNAMWNVHQQKKNGAYNLCQITNTSQTIDGVTWTVYNDGRVIANCSSNNHAKSIFWIWGSYNTRKKFNYPVRVCGAPIGASTNTYHIGGVGIGGELYTEINVQAGTEIAIALVVAANAVVNNIVFKPIITTDLNAKYDDHESYAMTNKELTENVTAQKLTATANTSNIDNFSSYLYKIGNLVIGSVNFRLLANSSIGTELFTLGTVPKEYSLSVLSPVGTAQKSMQIAIQTNGKVLANNAVNADWFTGVFFYKA